MNIGMASLLHTYMDKHRVTSPEWNITGLGPSWMGKYYVAPEDYDTFLSILHDHVFIRGKKVSLVERHSRDSTPILIDLDFRYNNTSLQREFNTDDVRQFVDAYAHTLFHVTKHPGPLRFFVTMKPGPSFDPKTGVKKDGIHILCPDIRTTYDVPFTVRSQLLKTAVMKNCFPTATNDPKDILDESVIQRNNWFFYGSAKPEQPAYTVTHCFTIRYDTPPEEITITETSADLIRLFSLQIPTEQEVYDILHSSDPDTSPSPIPEPSEVMEETREWIPPESSEFRELLEERFTIDLSNTAPENYTAAREIINYIRETKGKDMSDKKIGDELGKLGLTREDKRLSGKTIKIWKGIK